MQNDPFQVCPELSPADYAALEKSIADLGAIMVPILEDENGNVIDGHNRKEIATRLGIDCPKFVRAGLSDEEKRSLARQLNTARRQFTTKQKQGLIDGQLQDMPQLSDRAIADLLSVDHKTVGTRRKKLVDSGEIPHTEKRIDKLGIERPGELTRGSYVDDSFEGRLDTAQRFEAIKREAKDAAGSSAAAVGNERSAKAANPDDENLYQTPWVAVDCLIKSLDAIEHRIWEPACGPGAIGQRLVDHGQEVIASDLINYSIDKDTGEENPFWKNRNVEICNFLTLEKQPFKRRNQIGAIITNPPYNKADEFIHQAHAMAIKHKIPVVAMLLRVNFLAGCGEKRCQSLDAWPPSDVIVFSRRLPMMHRDDYEGEKGDSRLDCAWFVWRLETRDYGLMPHIERIDWKAALDLTDIQAAAIRDGAAPDVLTISEAD